MTTCVLALSRSSLHPLCDFAHVTQMMLHRKKFSFFNKIKMSDDNKKRISSRSFKEKEKINGFLELLFLSIHSPSSYLSLTHTHALTLSLSIIPTNAQSPQERECVRV